MKTLKDLDEEIVKYTLNTPYQNQPLIEMLHLWKADIIERDKIIDERIQHIEHNYKLFTKIEDKTGCERCDAKIVELKELKKQLEGKK